MNHSLALASAPETTADSDPSALASLLKAASDPLRLTVLRVLSQESYGVLELCQILNHKQSGLSHHLKVLAKAGLVTTRREGNSIFYRRSERALLAEFDALHQALLTSVDQLPLSPEVAEGVEQVRHERAARCSIFFTENAAKFRAQQELIASYELYGPVLAELLDSHLPKSCHALEIGPGEGEFLLELAARCSQITALDTSAEMLQRAQQRVTSQSTKPIHFLHGTLDSCDLNQGSQHCVVINMVLHHVPSPAEMIRDAAALLAPEGQLYITELCHHDQGWAREACGDLWLGFEPEELTQWTRSADLAEGESIYLAQRNGFRVQIRQFVKKEM